MKWCYKLTNGWTDNAIFRVAFATENNIKYRYFVKIFCSEVIVTDRLTDARISVKF